MVERTGTRPVGPQPGTEVKGGESARVETNPVQAKPVQTKGVDDGPAKLAEPDAPTHSAEGDYHHRSLGGGKRSNLVSIRLADASKEFRSEGARAFADLISQVAGGPDRVKAANIALDTLVNYLDQRTDHANQVGSLHAQIAAAAPDERVPLLRRAVHTLRRAVREGILPPDNQADLNRLAKVSQGMGWNFDLDDNIASLDTKIIVFEKGTTKERALSTTEFAEVREKIGKSGELQNYEIRTDDGAMNSFRNFRDGEDPGVFWRDLSAAMQAPGWKGPSWSAFQRAMSSPETAKSSTIITARGHYPNTIHAALRRLVDHGHLENVPPRENIFPVSLPGLADGLGGAASSPSAAKVRVMEQYLDRLQTAPLGPSAQQVIPPDGGRGRRYMHLWGFSDDDYGTFKKTVAELGEHVKQGRWPDVKITVFFTGQGHPEAEPHAVVISSDGSTRRRLPAEEKEVDRALEAINKLQRAQV